MVGIEALTGHTHAIATLVLVLAEAVVLYVGYGAVTRVVTPLIERVIEGN